MQDTTLKFKVKSGKLALKDDCKTVVSIEFAEELTVSLWYSFNENPLILHANAKADDEAVLLMTPVHISLYINGALVDEEWPCGDIATDALSSCDGIEIIEGIQIAPEPCRKGISAHELRRSGVNIGDCMPFSSPDGNGRYHLFWLYDRHHHLSKWYLGAHQWAHSSTADLVHWDEHPMAVSITEQYEGSICTGSTFLDNGIYYAWYAIRMSDRISPARITYSYSSDGENFTKSGKFFTLPERYSGKTARDPKMVFFEGKYHLLITTLLLETNNGCIAHLVSEKADMTDYTDLGPIMEWHDNEEPECPDYFEMDGRYYLVWSIKTKARYAFADKPFGEGGWTYPEDNILDCGNVPKSAVCPWNGKRVFAGFIPENEYAGDLVLKTASTLSDGRIVLE